MRNKLFLIAFQLICCTPRDPGYVNNARNGNKLYAGKAKNKGPCVRICDHKDPWLKNKGSLAMKDFREAG